MKIQSALLAATFLAALSFTPPAQAATIPPNILKLLVELGYLAPLTGVTLTSAQITDTNARYNLLIQEANLNYQVGALH